MKPNTSELFRAKQFAELAGVTVRALHHYDRLGLLRPKQRSAAGYRLYAMRDFARLEQIVVFKSLGIPLKQIRALLESETRLAGALERQQDVLYAKRNQLDRAIRAIANARDSLESSGAPDWKLFQLIVREIEMQKQIEWKGKYFSPAARAKVAARRSQLSADFREKSERDWNQLYDDVQSSLNEDPSGPKAQSFAARWKKLIEDFTGGDPEILAGLEAMMADKANWPAEARGASRGTPEARAFLEKALAASETVTLKT